ncbi:uncharacterized protein T551_03241 [Pneumocystis jirovecii RU7]|uniref:Uncharacterized protein n=1 Tax=Pneumocystis jirovecii (strain RU7) TaxID=1408657 RepID=A0A0W4ZFT9_PNEJ7|nr:uncharacterized protein T551_03241 [Pneumocystis jirovecii RU7]KTW27247.1 hypothetical protein T551_03241 [Pneumocystis jirovecii RU7]
MSLRDENKREDKELSTSPDPLDVLSSPKVSYLTPLRLRGSTQTRQEFGLSSEIRRIGLFVDIGNDKEEVSPKKTNQQVTKTSVSEHIEKIPGDVSDVFSEFISNENSKKDLDKSNEKTKKTTLKRKKKTTIKQCLNVINQNIIQDDKDDLKIPLKKKAKMVDLNIKKKYNAVASKKRKIESEDHSDQNSINLDNTSITSSVSMDKLTENSIHSNISSKESYFEEKHFIPTQDIFLPKDSTLSSSEGTVILNSQQKNTEFSLNTFNILENDIEKDMEKTTNIKKDIQEEDNIQNNQENLLQSESLIPLNNISYPSPKFTSPRKNKLIEISSSSNTSAKRVVDVLRRTGHFELESVVWGQKDSSKSERISEQKSIWTKNEWRLLEQLLIKHGKAKLALDEFLSLNQDFPKREVNKRLRVLLFKKKENCYIYLKKDKTDNSIKVQEDSKISSFIFGWKNWLRW